MNQEKNDRQNKRHLIIFSVFFIAILVIITLLTRYSKNPEELGAENSNNEEVVFQEEESVNDVGEGKEGEEEPQESYQYPAILTSEDLEDIDTSDWLTYENETYGFSLKYPSAWGLSGEDTTLTTPTHFYNSFSIKSPDFDVLALRNKGASLGVGLLRVPPELKDDDPLEYLKDSGCILNIFEVEGYDYIFKTDKNSNNITRYWYTDVILNEWADKWNWNGISTPQGTFSKSGEMFRLEEYPKSCYKIHSDYLKPDDLKKDMMPVMIFFRPTINDPSYYPIAMKIVDSFNYIKKD